MYKLQSNTSYEFRVWANNYLGAGEAVTTVATTLSQLTDEQLFEILLRDVKEFDPIVWTYAVSVSMTALIILGCTVCFMLLRDHLEELEIKRQLQGKSARPIGTKLNSNGLFWSRGRGLQHHQHRSEHHSESNVLRCGRPVRPVAAVHANHNFWRGRAQ